MALIENFIFFKRFGVLCIEVINYILMTRELCFLIMLTLALSIRFNYNLPRYQIQCFHESVEKDSRYQIAIKGESSVYYLHVVDKKPLHEDSRTVNAEYKYYSSFAENNEVLTFCIGNLGDSSIYFDIQFYHGIYLEDSFDEKVQGRELEDLSDRWSQMLKMVESNYDIYRSQLLGRRVTSQRITVVLTLMVAVIIVGTIIIKLVYYKKTVKYLKEKKLV